jgi:hypothetical protein
MFREEVMVTELRAKGRCCGIRRTHAKGVQAPTRNRRKGQEK